MTRDQEGGEVMSNKIICPECGGCTEPKIYTYRPRPYPLMAEVKILALKCVQCGLEIHYPEKKAKPCSELEKCPECDTAAECFEGDGEWHVGCPAGCTSVADVDKLVAMENWNLLVSRKLRAEVERLNAELAKKEVKP